MACSRLSSPFLRAKETKFRSIGRASTSTQRPAAILTPVLIMVLLAAVFAPATAFSQNTPPPYGSSLTPTATQLLDLSGQPLPGGGNGTYQQYTVNFTATSANPTITFAFRDDVNAISFTNASVVDLTADNGVNLLTNGSFSSGTGQSPTGWTWANVSGTNSAYYGMAVQSNTSECYSSPSCWYDGSYQGYDIISQQFTANVGDNFQISFEVAENSGCGTGCNFSDVSSDGVAGIDVVAYVSGGAPVSQTLTLNLLNTGTGQVTDNQGGNPGALGTCYEEAGVVYQNRNGAVTAGPCTASYPVGTVVTLTATPNEPVACSPIACTFGDSTVTPAVPGWGGACTPAEKNANECILTMDSPLSATASFDVPGQTQVDPIPSPGTTITDTYSGGNNFTFTPGSGNGTTGNLSVTEIPFGDDLTTCNAIVQANFGPSAQCFDVLNGGGPGTDSMLEFAVTCPGSNTGGTCGAPKTQNFFGALGQDFSFSVGSDSDNPELGVSAGSLTYSGNTPNTNDTNPYVGVFQFTGSNALQPCTLAGPVTPGSMPGSGNIPFATNQISSFTFVDPGAQPVKSQPPGQGSCWGVFYGADGEAPTVSVAQPASNTPYQQGVSALANYTCKTVYNGSLFATGQTYPAVAAGSTGPYLTGTCSATDSIGGSVADGAQFDTTTVGPHTFIATVTDSAENTLSATVNYTVQGNSNTTLISSGASTYGQPVTFTATVAAAVPESGNPTPTGNVAWSSNTGCSMATLTGGVATCTTSSLGAGTDSVTANYSGDSNYSASGASVNQTVSQATSSVTVTCTTPQTYTGSPLTPCSATYNTSDGSSGPLTVSYSNNTSVGMATASASYAGDANHTGSSNSSTFSITQATSTVTVTCPASEVYTGTAQTPCSATATGAGGLNQTLTVSYSNNTNVGTATASASYPGDANHTGSNNSSTFSITAATPKITFGGATSVAVGSTATGTATSTSGVTPTFSTTSASSICTVTGAGAVTGVGAGSCVIVATAAATTNYSSATASESISITGTWTITPTVASCSLINYVTTVGTTTTCYFTVTNNTATAEPIIVNITNQTNNTHDMSVASAAKSGTACAVSGTTGTTLKTGASCEVAVTYRSDSDDKNGITANLNAVNAKSQSTIYVRLTLSAKVTN